MIITISIIIPTFHRKESLMRLMKSLTNQKGIQFEVIVVEQGEENKKEIEQLGRKLGLELHYIYLPQPSMTHARNMGATAAKGEYLLFLDDDVITRPGLLENHINNFQDPKVGATTGRVITPGQPVEEGRTDTARVSMFEVTEGYSSTIRQEVDTVVGCNMCWRTDVYKKLGGVDEQFTGNALREETDLSLRAKKLGYKIIFEPKAEVEHVRALSGGARKTEGRMKWYFDFFSNETYFFLKHRSSILLPVYLLIKLNWAMRCMFGFGREVSLRSIMTPKLGVLNGIKKYRMLRNYENRC
jgi:GT2 family glycosyltransferase